MTQLPPSTPICDDTSCAVESCEDIASIVQSASVAVEMPRCDRCNGREFLREYDLKQHLANSSRHNICYQCNKDFKLKIGLIQHWVNSERHHYCQRCNEHFDSDKELIEHKKANHHYCSFCNKVRSTFDVHGRWTWGFESPLAPPLRSMQVEA